MKNSKFLPLIIISLFFVLFPLTSFAGEWVPTGKPCSKDPIPPYYMEKEVTCPYSSLKGGDLHIKWTLPETERGGEVIKGEDIIDYCSITVYFGGPLKYRRQGERPLLRRVDDVYLIEPPVGSVFEIRCIGMCHSDSKRPQCRGKVGDVLRYLENSSVSSSHVSIVSPDDSGQGTSNKTSSANPTIFLSNAWSSWQGLFK